MSKLFYSPVVGIDVSVDFSYVAILTPNGDVYKKSFKIKHDLNGFNHLINELKKVVEEFKMKTGIFMESTGVYHLSLFHYLNKYFDNTFVINPLITKSNKNVDIRKVKNDALSITTIRKFQNIKLSQRLYVDIFFLKNLVRINGFLKPKHLVAFFGVDSSVNELGNFKGDDKEISKRGTHFCRRELYAVALASIRNNRNGIPVNKVLLDYYQINMKGKKPKIALIAIIHKIINYIFAVLQNQTPFEQRDPKIHKQMFFRKQLFKQGRLTIFQIL
ncbi:IS110 family transposase [Clostridium beijerinckii]|uniref:IS110 family transposase n=1 Tax=Clostridium beijerinckii TaxID=1520 RepID=UPI0022E4AEC8|nr:transposase [Clostridium beijerinckii]